MKNFRNIKRNICIALIFALSVLINISSAYAQQVKFINDGRYLYQTVENDPLKTRIYTLENGLKVYLTVNKSEPRIQTYIAVATGSKNDPHDAQGLSHYLEHMLFKGTDKFGTVNYEKEKPYIDSIIALYDIRKKSKNEEERKMIYKEIDRLSGIASEFAIANEYDQMMSGIGAQGTNAYTSLEQTVYIENIPSNQLKKWLEIESERFRNPVMRLFHTELEAVYEEKNMSLDNDNSKVWEAFYAGLFPTHTYGTQTTLGSIEQLKNPSIQTIIDYYYENYVPGNMAICLSGDLDPDAAIKLIDEYFGKFSGKKTKEFVPPVEAPITSPVVKNVYGPSPEFVRFGYRVGGANTGDADLIAILENILSNGTAGLIDLNINQEQKVIDAYASTDVNKDYSVIFFGGKPKENQTLEEIRDLILGQIELVKEGKFPDWLIPAIISNFKLNRLRAYERNNERAHEFVTAFSLGIPWENYIGNIDRMSKITKDDIIRFTKENLNDNYVIVYKRTGEDTTIKKIVKPEITPVNINRVDKSEFLKQIESQTVEEIQPEFIDFKKEISSFNIKNNIPVNYVKNLDNDLYSLNFVIYFGTNNNKKLKLAIDYLKYLGTEKISPVRLKEEFYKLAGSFDVNVDEDETYISLSGLNENLEKSLQLLEELISSPAADEEALNNLIDDIIKQRQDAKLSKNVIMWSAMVNYAKFGKENPFTYRLSEKELREIKASELIEIIRNIFTYKQKVLYYGPSGTDELSGVLDRVHNTPADLKSAEREVLFKEKDNIENEVYVVNYDMQQAEILMVSKSDYPDKKKFPVIYLFNEYFGGGMQSIVFQEMRESKALAYSAFSNYQIAYKKDKPDYIVAYIGTQADKLSEAMSGMKLLLDDMPAAEKTFENSKNLLKQQFQTDRISRSAILNQFEYNNKLGIDYDFRKDIYEQIPSISLNDISDFHKKYFNNKKYTTLVLGDIKKLDMKLLEQYGKVKVLTLEEIFGY